MASDDKTPTQANFPPNTMPISLISPNAHLQLTLSPQINPFNRIQHYPVLMYIIFFQISQVPNPTHTEAVTMVEGVYHSLDNAKAELKKLSVKGAFFEDKKGKKEVTYEKGTGMPEINFLIPENVGSPMDPKEEWRRKNKLWIVIQRCGDLCGTQ
jgi:hypothetical protein